MFSVSSRDIGAVFDLRHVLAMAPVYRTFSNWVSGNFWPAYVQQYICPDPNDRILDVGCGPADILAALPETIQYVGIDASATYLEDARQRFATRKAEFRQEILGQGSIHLEGQFDIVMATGLLHHLNQEEATALMTLVRQALKPGGRLITLDGCYTRDPQAQSRWARKLLSWDRGQFVRHQDEYEAIAQQVFPTVQSELRHDLLRMPYTHLIMRCQAAAEKTR